MMKAIAVAAALTLAATFGAGAEPLKIKLGVQAIPDKLLPMSLHRADITPHAGTDYDVEFVRFTASSVEVTALATGDINLATLGYSSLGIALENARMDDLRLVADQYRDGVQGYYSNEFMVLKDSPIQRIEDLKGKVVASNGAGSVVDIAMRYMLKRHGLEDRRDYTMIEAALPNMFSMLAEQKAQLVTINAIYSANPKIQAGGRTLFTERDALGVTEFAFFCARTGFLNANRAALSAFFEDLVRSTRWMLDPAHRGEAIKFSSDYSKQSPDILASYYLLPEKDVYRDPDSRPDVAALQRNLEAMRELGFMKSSVDVTKYVDLTFLDAAVKRIDQARR
jgi:sulfonate transport system substrate-binding protein